MILIVGLGNPGKEYKDTRHNIGKRVVSQWQKIIGFPDFKFQKKLNAFISRGFLGEKSVTLALPETFMNRSGHTVKSLTSSCKIKAANLWIVHDDIDLPLGKIKIAISRGSAGHKGIESIIKELKTKDFIRFRVGISPPEIKKIKGLESFVLQRFSKKEQKAIEESIEKTVDAIEIALKESLDRAMQKYN